MRASCARQGCFEPGPAIAAVLGSMGLGLYLGTRVGLSITPSTCPPQHLGRARGPAGMQAVWPVRGPQRSRWRRLAWSRGRLQPGSPGFARCHALPFCCTETRPRRSHCQPSSYLGEPDRARKMAAPETDSFHELWKSLDAKDVRWAEWPEVNLCHPHLFHSHFHTINGVGQRWAI